MLIIIEILKPGRDFRISNYFEFTENILILTSQFSLQILLNYYGGKKHPKASVKFTAPLR